MVTGEHHETWVSRPWIHESQPQTALDLAPQIVQVGRKPVVWLDVDGVLADFVQACLDVWFAETGLLVSKDELKDWSIFDAGLDRAIVAPHIERPGFCYGIPPFPEAAKAVRDLQAWAEVYACTSPWTESSTWVSERTAWLMERLGIDYHHQIHTHAKDLVKADVIVDDRPSNVEKWARAFPEGVALLWDTPHNRNASAGKRVRSWNEVLVHVVTCAGSKGWMN